MHHRLHLVLIAVIATGCGGGAGDGDRPTPPSRYQTRAFTGECVFRPTDPTEGALAGVVDAVTGGFISGALGRIGKALRAAGEEDADVVVGRYAAEFEPGNPSACVFVAKGHWSASSDDAHKVGETEVRFGSYYLVDPDFFLEVALDRSSGGDALRLVPNYFEYHRLIGDDSDRDGQHDRGVALEVAVHAPGVGPKDKEATGATLVLGTMSTGFAYNLRSGQRRALGQTEQTDLNEGGDYLPLEYTSPWFKTFAPQAQPATNSKGAGGGGQTPVTGGAGGEPSPSGGAGGPSRVNGPGERRDDTARQVLPRTVSVTFTETRAPRKFLLFLADVFDASSDEIQEAAELALLESRQAEAQLAAAQASTTLMTDYLAKLSNAEVAIIAYCGASSDDTPEGRTDRLQKSSAASVAQWAANVSALAASQPRPYTSFVVVDEDQIDGSFCSN